MFPYTIKLYSKTIVMAILGLYTESTGVFVYVAKSKPGWVWFGAWVPPWWFSSKFGPNCVKSCVKLIQLVRSVISYYSGRADVILGPRPSSLLAPRTFNFADHNYHYGGHSIVWYESNVVSFHQFNLKFRKCTLKLKSKWERCDFLLWCRRINVVPLIFERIHKSNLFIFHREVYL